MKRKTDVRRLFGGFLLITLVSCALLLASAIYLATCHGGNNLYSFSEPFTTLSDGWTLTDSAGRSREISLPLTIDYRTDGRYTLSRALPEMDSALATPAFRFYSNYVDVAISLDGAEVYSFPPSRAAFSGATGNTYHFVRLPVGYAGKTISVDIGCQLGSDITYLLNPPVLGAKATMLRLDIMRSLPILLLAGCMSVLAIGICVLYFAFHKKLELSRSSLYTALFALLFAIYISFETSFAQVLMPNGYLLCFSTLMLLALAPIPLIGIFLDAVSKRFKPFMYGLMLLCAVNLIAQMLLNFLGVKSVRVMLPATHAVILFSIFAASLCLFFSDRKEKPGARRSFFSAIPMIIGGLADITLLNLNMPSPNNCFWFAIGVTIFIIYQLCGFISGYFELYRASLETNLLTSMAYHDMLAGIDNRNAYERKLKELSRNEPSEKLCCIVADINDLKVINDTLGHQAGDRAISEVGAILSESMPRSASFFRTGGDEFVILLEDFDGQRAGDLAEKLAAEAHRRGEMRSIPITLAIGFGQYLPSDGNIIDFIRRVDTLMYECKRRQKCDCVRTERA